MNFLKRVASATVTSDVSITATTVGTANQIISLGAVTYENVPHVLEFAGPRYLAPAASTFFILRDATTVIGTLAVASTSVHVGPFYISYPITPSAASHTYNLAAWLSGAGTGTMEAGSGGTAGDATTYLQIQAQARRVPT